MPKFDDRFARQNRYGPPPEFPLASASSGIVHHLSGPNEHALARPRRRGGRDRPAMRLSRRKGSRLVLPSLCSRVSYCPAPRARVRLLGPCFKTGRRGDRLQPQTPGVEREPPEQAGGPSDEDCEQFPPPTTGEPWRPGHPADAESLLGHQADSSRAPITLSPKGEAPCARPKSTRQPVAAPAGR